MTDDPMFWPAVVVWSLNAALWRLNRRLNRRVSDRRPRPMSDNQREDTP